MAIKPPDPGEREAEEEALSLGPLAAAEKRLLERFFRHTSKGETTFFPWWGSSKLFGGGGKKGEEGKERLSLFSGMFGRGLSRSD